ncbi:MAG TPA: 3'(2'),5'-bisphosphate nucleotidase CysQ [Xanthobacteraceae bacterium]|nr:3'(2'),5'-bisphosphate nucleotidase CysQ [Xanthobacteraceae bacterium]
MSISLDERLLHALTGLAWEAADTILPLRHAALAVQEKADGSPVTRADAASEAILCEGLARLMPGVPVVSEERAEGQAWPKAESFVLLDPLDGTREFIAGRDEFTVNIGLIAGGVPAAGVVAAPARATAWRGIVGRGAERIGRTSAAVSIATRKFPGAAAVALVSRSHLDAATQALLDRAGIAQRRPCGSALKFALLAEGAADIYPRLAPTRAWDVAAGHAVLAAAGGRVARANGAALRYGEAAGFVVPDFLACGDASALERLA